MRPRVVRVYGRLLNERAIRDEQDDFLLVEVAAGLGDADQYGIAGTVKVPQGHVTRRRKDLGILDCFWLPLWMAELVAKTFRPDG